MGSIERALDECVCMCGHGKFKVSYRIPDQGREGIEHLWEIDCKHCRELYTIEKRGHLIGALNKVDEVKWEKETQKIGKTKSKKLLHKPKFIKILFKISDV